MNNERKKREKSLTTFNQLLKDYKVEIVDSSESRFPPDTIPLTVDGSDVVVHIDLSHLPEDNIDEETE